MRYRISLFSVAGSATCFFLPRFFFSGFGTAATNSSCLRINACILAFMAYCGGAKSSGSLSKLRLSAVGCLSIFRSDFEKSFSPLLDELNLSIISKRPNFSIFCSFFNFYARYFVAYFQILVYTYKAYL